MPDFWDKVLGAQAQQQQPPQQQARDIPWWQRTLTPAQSPASEQQQPEVEELPAENDGSESKARTQWAKHDLGVCPGCGSGNYVSHPDAPGSRPRCYDCGYPISQSGSGVSLKGKNVGPIREARQTPEARTSDFNAQNIFQHLG